MKTKIALAISAALLASSVNANTQNTVIKPNKAMVSYSASAQEARTESGMKNQIDKQSGQATFSWASTSQKTPDLGPVSNEFKTRFASDYYLNQLTGLSTQKDSSNMVIASIHDQGRGAKIVKYKQQINGVEIFNREFNIMMDNQHKFVASSGFLADSKGNNDSSSNRFVGREFGSSADAISLAFEAMGGNKNEISLSKNGLDSKKYERFSAQSKSEKFNVLGQPRAKKVFFEANGKLIPAHYVELEVGNIDSVDSEHNSYIVGKNGKILFKNNLISHAKDFNYRAYIAENGTPWDSPHGNVIPATAESSPTAYITAPHLDAPLVSISHGPISTNDPWLADDATTTNGNNVNAYVDIIAPNGFSNGDFTAETTSDATFDHPYDVTSAEYSINNRKAAIVNLFLVNNYLHDDFYDHGFDEASGNAQLVNYERGGVEGDPILAEVQDSSGFNNANMSTPADGGSPRMQMYLWDKADLNGLDYGVSITSSEEDELIGSGTLSALGPSFFSDIEGKLVLLRDELGVDPDVGTTIDGCNTVTNADAIAGNIAIIDRGTCNFTAKIINAQAAGAIAVLVANNRDGDATLRLGGADPESLITIPNMMISQNDGIKVYAAMQAGDVTVEMFSNKKPRDFKASSWDNGIVAHEWGHYISNRLVGNGNGLTNNQGRSMGEGWGDFHALLLLSEEDDALIAGNEKYNTAYSATSYIANFKTGIRSAPYSTDREINSLTFASISDDAEVHASGEIWAVMLWDSYVSLINDERHTFSEAQSLMKDYLVAGYKMTPLAPTFTEARDALLAAAYANDVEDYKLILAAFASRGMGLGAISPDRASTDHAGVVESSATELSAFSVASHQLNTNYEGLTVGYCSNDGILDKGETGTVDFTLKNTGNIELTGLTGTIEVVSDHDVTFANNGAVTFDDVAVFGTSTSSPIEFTLNDAETSDLLEFKIILDEQEGIATPEEYNVSAYVNFDFKTKAIVNNATISDMEDFSLFNEWQQNVIFGGENALSTQQFDNSGNIPFFASFGFDLGEQAMVLNNNGFQSDVAVETKSFQIGYEGNFEVSFWHFYGLENGWDGGVVEISINGDEWTDVTNVGGVFDVGYNGELETQDVQVLSERPVFTGRNNSAGWGNQDRISFGTALNGSEVQIRFRIGTDSVAADFGWWIDNVEVTNVVTPIFYDQVAGDTFACDNRLPSVAIKASANDVKEGEAVTLTATAIDANASDELTYSWKQTVGTEATLSGTDTAEITFTAPEVSANVTQLTFELTVNDGTSDVVSTIDVKVRDIPALVVAEKTKKKSGGSLGWLALILTPLAILRRRNR